MADCLEDPHLGDDIIVANHEYDKNMKSIETVSLWLGDITEQYLMF